MQLSILAAAMAFTIAGCATKSSQTVTTQVPKQENSEATEAPSLVEASAAPITATLTGTISAGGTAGGKTLAAWNGFDVGEEVYLFRPRSTENLAVGAPDEVMMHAPPEVDMKPLLGVSVRLTATWLIPEPVAQDLNSPMQMPVSSGPNGLEVVQREPTLRALDIVPIESP